MHITNTGRARLDDAARARFLAGELVAWDEAYARSAPLFETGAAEHAWLNSAVTIAVNQLSLGHVDFGAAPVGAAPETPRRLTFSPACRRGQP